MLYNVLYGLFNIDLLTATEGTFSTLFNSSISFMLFTVTDWEGKCLGRMNAIIQPCLHSGDIRRKTSQVKSVQIECPQSLQLSLPWGFPTGRDGVEQSF